MPLERDDAVNWSSLKYMAISPRHYIHALSVPRADTDAFRLGRAMHCLVLEPDKFDGRYAIEPRFNRTMKNETAIARGYSGGKEAAAEWLENVGDREPIGAEMYATACSMRDAILSDPVAAPLVASGYSEHKIEWVDQTGIKCRGRVDHVDGATVDIKGTRSLLSFERDCAKYGYGSQLSFYADGLAAAGIVTTGPPCLIAIENVAPFDVQVLTFEPDDLAVGRRVYRRCLDRLLECRRTGKWPGVSNGVSRRVVLPPWADPIMEEMDVVIDGHTVKL